MSDETRFFALMLQLVQSIPDGSALRWCFDPDVYLRAALEALLESEAIGAAAISVFADAASNTPMEVITVGAALVRIHSQQYASRVERLRALLASKGPEAYDRAKKAITAVTFGGTFAPTRAAANLVQHSGVVHGDIDHVLDPHTLKKALCADPRTLYCFISPSGSGIKLGTRVEPVSSDRAYKHAWTIVAQEYERQYGAAWDASGKDVSRLCFMSADAGQALVGGADRRKDVSPQATLCPALVRGG